MDVDGDSIKFRGRKKPDRLLGKVERSWTRAVGSGVPAPPTPSRPYTSPSLGTRQVEMGSSRWPETLEKRRGSGVS